ncbi:hypothetical protein P3X46_033106 [Hevea brasiliensis]|uniref:Transcription repressor n=1 Tax=Hevea brasiliensis TaxID=3981 RepID=A0ABQ9KGM8_HEVBR|nr:transcription repressor OFP5 [Hevea brasiliensis]KAJ9135989.1 hypothetical protein P3X46_033106 [Hevea brasiliensis]
MKWGRKKSSSSASSGSFFISHILPTSWLTKFKQMNINSGKKHAKQKVKWNSVCTSSSRCVSSGGKFYGGDGDAFWRLSFGEESLDGLKSKNVLQSVRYNSDDDLEFPPSSYHSYRSKASRMNGTEQVQKLSNMVSQVRKMRRLPKEEEILPEPTCTKKKVAEIRTPRLKVERAKKLKKENQRVFKKKQLELDGRPHVAERIPRNAVVKNMYETEPRRTGGMVEREDRKLAAADSRKDFYFSSMNSRDSYGRKLEDCVFAAENGNSGFSAGKFSFEWQKLKQKKIEELKSTSEEQRKSLYISRESQRKRPKQSSKVRVYSPRTASKAEICKIKALEDMKKAKLKMKKKAKEKEMEEFNGLESFAMVKCSHDPQKDFRDSMIEMIKEQRINQPEELEELLACYLTLNSDEYHDLIIRVFRQVWFDLNQACFDIEFTNEECY